jgi:hypothetical protein
MKKIRMLTLLVALCSTVESQASLFTLTEKNGETTCSVPQAETILKNYWKNEIAVRKGSESAVFEATMQHLEVVQADNVDLGNIKSLVTANIVAKNLTISAFTNLIELKIDGCEDLTLSYLDALTKLMGPLPKKTSIKYCNALPQLDVTGCEDLELYSLDALTKLMGPLPKKTVIECCNALPQLDVTGCEDLQLKYLPALTKLVGPLPKKTVIEGCKALPQLDVTGCEDLELSFLDQLEKLSGTVPVKATITGCPQLKEIEKVAFDAQGNPQESAALVNFLKDKTSENLPPSLSYLKKVGASDWRGNPIGDNTQNLTSILENVKVVLQGTYSLDQFFDIVTAASENKKGFYLEVDRSLRLNYDLEATPSPAKALEDRLNSLRDAAVKLNVEENRLIISHGAQELSLFLPKVFWTACNVTSATSDEDLNYIFSRDPYSNVTASHKRINIFVAQGKDAEALKVINYVKDFLQHSKTNDQIDLECPLTIQQYEELVLLDVKDKLDNLRLKFRNKFDFTKEEYQGSLERILKSLQDIAETKHYSFYLHTTKTDANIYISVKGGQEEKERKIFTFDSLACEEDSNYCDDIYSLENFRLLKYYEHISPEQLKDIAKKCGIQDHESQ